MPDQIQIRLALPSEQRALEALQMRASLSNPGDRDALLANPDAIESTAETRFGTGLLVRRGL